MSTWVPATLDTKGAKAAFVRERLWASDIDVDERSVTVG